jgi:hypothetical protein
MMKQGDFAILREMQQAVASRSQDSLGEVVERLLWLRDKLMLDDADWYHDLTQHLATLDSASTFYPANDIEGLQLKVVVQEAADQITLLIGSKLH